MNRLRILRGINTTVDVSQIGLTAPRAGRYGPQGCQRSELKQGYSTAGTTGQGWFLMLSSVDAAYPHTEQTGTTIVLKMDRTTPEPVIPISQWAGGDISTPIPLGDSALA